MVNEDLLHKKLRKLTNKTIKEEATILVREIFKREQDLYEYEIIPKAEYDFLEYMKTLYPKKYKTYDGSQPKSSKYSDKPKYKTHLKTSPTLPRVKYWAISERNIQTSDRLRLEHIPHLGDTFDDTQLVIELKKAYPEGIHGSTKGCGEFINDYLMFRLLTSLKTKWNEDFSYIHAEIFKQFPDKYTFTQLESGVIYQKLKKRFNSDEQGNHFSNAIILKPITCVFCSIINCKIHNYNEDFDKVCGRLSRGKMVARGKPCGISCYFVTNSKVISIIEIGTVIAKKGFVNTIKCMITTDDFSVCHLTRLFNTVDIGEKLRLLTCQEMGIYIDSLSNCYSESTVEDKFDRRKHSRSFIAVVRNIDNNRIMDPCDHDGPCYRNKKCPCFNENMKSVCSKYCRCSRSCTIKFPGCSCTGVCNNVSCGCYIGNWECDPDICVSCNCDPDGEQNGKKRCQNISLQLGKRKKLKVGVSNLNGYGCFIMERASKGDLIIEYTGEIISAAEADRRALINDIQQETFVFCFNKEQLLDAHRFGSLARFINHSRVAVNCYAKLMIVDGQQRVGIYAGRTLKPGEELFFDYKDDEGTSTYVDFDTVP